MKEATAINVQSKLRYNMPLPWFLSLRPAVHVEQFKQELSREVMAMTQEVGRLHREKQQVENQISDLFSFYLKHKQAEIVNLSYPWKFNVGTIYNILQRPLQTMKTNASVPLLRQAYPQERERARANIPGCSHEASGCMTLRYTINI